MSQGPGVVKISKKNRGRKSRVSVPLTFFFKLKINNSFNVFFFHMQKIFYIFNCPESAAQIIVGKISADV